MDEVYAQIQKKAVMDADFRKALLADPNAVIEKETGIALTAGFKANIVEADPAYQATYVLPSVADGELSEDDLDKVAGGVCHWDYNSCDPYDTVCPEYVPHC